MSAFENLARQCVRVQAESGRLPFLPETIGSDWGRSVQVGVAAASWQTRELLWGECKWGMGWVDRAVVREMVEGKTPRVRQGLTKQGDG